MQTVNARIVINASATAETESQAEELVSAAARAIDLDGVYVAEVEITDSFDSSAQPTAKRWVVLPYCVDQNEPSTPLRETPLLREDEIKAWATKYGLENGEFDKEAFEEGAAITMKKGKYCDFQVGMWDSVYLMFTALN